MDFYSALSGIEQAMWDIAGKARAYRCISFWWQVP
jgi:L-alanine-DL-glutamate epimerase-like enolase superfamily enzyme